MDIITAATITPGTTIVLWNGANKVERTVASITDTVDRETLVLLQVTIKWTDGTSTTYLPDSEFTAV